MHDRSVPDVQQGSSYLAGRPLYGVWAAMKRRCNNPNAMYWERYGGRGIKVCDEWSNSYRAFEEWGLANGYEPGLTLDREDNNGDYTPENCRWATYQTNAENRSNSVLVTAWGETKNVSRWATDPRCGVREPTIRQRIRKGWDPEIAISAPPNSQPRPPVAKKVYCVNGHPLSGENVRIDRQGARVCRTCARERNRRSKQRRKAER